MEYLKRENRFIANKISRSVSVEEVVDHPFLDLMARANPVMDGNEVLEMLQLFMELVGDAYLLKVRNKLGVIQEVWPLMAHLVEIVPHATEYIDHYKYGLGLNPSRFMPNEVVHFKFPNPNDYYYGMGPLAAAAGAVALQQNMDAYEENLFRNNARPDQLLIPEQPIRKEARDKLMSEFNRMTRGISNTGKTIAMPYGVRLEQLTFSPKELAFLKGRKTTREDIATIFDIPATLFSTEEGGRSKDEAAEYTHAKYGVYPRCRRLAYRLNQDLIQEYDGRLFCAFDNPVPEDKEFKLKRQIARLRSGFSSINQERAEEGYAPVEWGPEPILSSNMVPMSEAAAARKAAAQAAETAAKQQKDGNEEPGDDVKPGRTKSVTGKDAKE
jgi:HK97 family phage portal protein